MLLVLPGKFRSKADSTAACFVHRMLHFQSTGNWKGFFFILAMSDNFQNLLFNDILSGTLVCKSIRTNTTSTITFLTSIRSSPI
jgi:hypothetical protein